MENPVRHYDWGSRTAIPALLGRPVPAERPQAELWMGAHPSAPSQVYFEDGTCLPLPQWIAGRPKAVLGEGVARRFQGRLPFLFKVLAAAEPLSIQAHPDAEQAREGFERENAAGIATDARERNYRDPSAKPELLCAIRPFWALRGFRPVREIVDLLEGLADGGALAGLIEELKQRPDPDGLKRFYRNLMTMEHDRPGAAVEPAVAAARRRAGRDPAFDWIVQLHDKYRGDAGVLSPALLNLVKLEPGEAMFLPAGELHAYLEGFGVEIMANSDNTLRGGLTPKHVDVPELLRVLKFVPSRPEILTPEETATGEKVYASPAEEFRLSAVEVRTDRHWHSPAERSVEILFCLKGSALLLDPATGSRWNASRGESFVVPAVLPPYQLEGEATFFKASVPL
jgi:mannose-6-phosphate isomerase